MENNKNSFKFDKELRAMEFTEYQFNSIVALLKYKDNNMIDNNMTRLKSSIDIVIESLEELKSVL